MSTEPDPPHKSPPPPDIKKPTPPPDLQRPSTTPPSVSALDPKSSSPIKVNTRPDSDEDDSLDPTRRVTGIPLGTRVAALGIDLAIALGLSLAIILVSKMTFDFVSALAWPVFIAFVVTRDGLPFLKGQSPGKSAMKIKAVTESGESLAGNWQPVVIRNAVLLIPFFAIVELVVLLTREDKPDQGIRLGDEWAKTRVVKAKPPEPLEESPETPT